MQVQFVVGSLLCSERFFSGYSGFPSPQKRTFPNSYNPGQKSLGQYFNIHIFLSFLGSLLKQWILFEILLQFSLPPPYTKLKLGKNSGHTRPTLFVEWGEGLDLCELENAPETQKCPKTFVHNCSSKNSHFQNEAKSKKPFLWEWVSFAWEWKIIFTFISSQLTSLRNRGLEQLGNGLFDQQR